MTEFVLSIVAVGLSTISLCGTIAESVFRVRGVSNWSLYGKFIAVLGISYVLSCALIVAMLSYFVIGLVGGYSIVAGWWVYVYPLVLVVCALLWGVSIVRVVGVYRLALSKTDV